MKPSLFITLLAAYAASALAMDFTTEDGRVLKDARVLKVSKTQAWISCEDGVVALPLGEAVITAFQITVSDEPKQPSSLLKSEIENWLIDIKNNNINYRPSNTLRPPRIQSSAPVRRDPKPVKESKQTYYNAEQLAELYVPAEDNQRQITVVGTVTQIFGRKSSFKIILDNAVVYTYFSPQIPKSFDMSGNAKSIGPYTQGQKSLIRGRCQGKDSSGYIIISD
ncbi:MAG: hypothetical protein LBD30_06205 [Verrucomicrobiales bacterium]|jgi:hypothetical protein|nr:hypothetical protein [Verrucomicrobiales bacterium]